MVMLTNGDDEDDATGLGFTGPLSSLRTSGSTTSPGTDRMRQVGLSLLGKPEEIEDTIRGNKDMQMAAIDRAISRIQGIKDAQSVNTPLLAAAAGFLSPTKSGSFSEGAGNAISAALPQIAAGREEDLDLGKELAGLDIKQAEIPSKELLTRLGISEKFMQAAESADARRAALARFGQPNAKVVAGVGLVEYNPANGTTRVLVQSPDPSKDPKVHAAIERMLRRDAGQMEFPDAASREQWIADQKAITLSGTGRGAGTTGAPASAPAPAVPGPSAPPQLPQAGPSAAAPPAPPPGVVLAAGTQPTVPMPQPSGPAPVADVPQISPIPGSMVPAITGSGRPKVPTLRDPAQEKEDIAAAAQRAKAQEEEATQTAALATEMSSQRSRIQALKTQDIKTGRLEPFKAVLGNWGKALGIPIPDSLNKAATDVPIFNHLAMQFVLDEQLKQKGVQTEGDARRIGQTFAQIENPQEANDMIIRIMDAQSQRGLDKQAFYSSWRETHNSKSIAGAKQAWDDFTRTTPLYVKMPNGEPTTFYEYMDAAKRQNADHPNWYGEAITRWKSHAEKTGQT